MIGKTYLRFEFSFLLIIGPSTSFILLFIFTGGQINVSQVVICLRFDWWWRLSWFRLWTFCCGLRATICFVWLTVLGTSRPAAVLGTFAAWLCRFAGLVLLLVRVFRSFFFLPIFTFAIGFAFGIFIFLASLLLFVFFDSLLALLIRHER